MAHVVLSSLSVTNETQTHSTAGWNLKEPSTFRAGRQTGQPLPGESSAEGYRYRSEKAMDVPEFFTHSLSAVTLVRWRAKAPGGHLSAE